MEKKNVEKLQSYNRRKPSNKASSGSVANSNGNPEIEIETEPTIEREPVTVNGDNVEARNVYVCSNIGVNEVTCQARCDNRKVCQRKSGCGREIKTGMNGIDVRLNGADYSRTVCDVYRHETDLIFGRTRGGVLNNTETHETSVNEETDTSLSFESSNGHELENIENEPLLCVSTVSDTELINEQGNECGRLLNGGEHNGDKTSDVGAAGGQNNGILAPLASPESFSDEDDGVITDIDEQTILLSGSHHDETLDIDAEVPDTEPDVSEFQDEGVNDCVPNDSVDCDDLNLDTEDVEEVHCTTNGAPNDSDCVDSDIECLMENVDLEEDNEVENNVVEVLEVTDLPVDNNDDIGDFIEADLPPNVERLVFFSRDSTSDEDEGCGDEVLPTNDEDVISDNETIDPTDAGYTSPRTRRRSSISDQSNVEMSNALSGNVNSVRGEVFNIHPCNISCDKSTEDNNADYGISADCRCSDECSIVECSSCNSLSNHDNDYSTGSADCSSSASIVGKYSCARCDRAMHIDSERQRELGVNICDKCFAELQTDQCQSYDSHGGSRHRSQLGASGSSGTNYLNRNCRNALMPLNNNYDKVSNNSLGMVRFSSSDSDPYDRIYVSDSSELFSPDGEHCGESLFQSTTSDRTMVQSDQFSDSRNQQEGRPLHRQSMSLDYSSPSELFSIAYNTRRSRSLDQQMLRCANHSYTDNSSADEPNIAISSSDLPDNDRNSQQNVFEQQTYNVPLLVPTCSSSDEEENIRMPGVNELDYTSDMYDRSDLAANLELTNDILYGACSKDKLSRGQKMRLDDEPIYEDIEQLELLLEECGDRDSENTGTVQPQCTKASKMRRKRRTRSPVLDVEKVMIWNEYEAYVVQVKQIGTSACGPTAVLNVLKAFDFQVDKEEVTVTIRSNLRMEAAPIPYYLFSRYNAGTTAQDLVDGVTSVTRGAIKGRFFHFYPPREIELLKWLGHWMKKGAVPVATLNLQRGVKPGWTIPDAWHHQMVYGVSCKGIYLTNPLEIVPESVIMEQLTSDSVLLVRRQDVVGRFRDWCPLNEIIKQRDLRWRTMNVLGQIVHVLREQSMYSEQMANMKGQLTSHVKIPAAYKAGIILFMRANSENIDELMSAPELPLKPDSQNT